MVTKLCVPIVIMTIAHYSIQASSNISYFLRIAMCFSLIYYSIHEANIVRYGIIGKARLFFLLFYPILLLITSFLSTKIGTTLLSVINSIYSPILTVCLIMAIQYFPKNTLSIASHLAINRQLTQTIDIASRGTTVYRTISTLSTCSEKTGSEKTGNSVSPLPNTFQNCFATVITLQYGLLHYSRALTSITYINEIASAILISFTNFKTLTLLLINKKTKVTLEQDIVSSMDSGQSPTNSAYYNQNSSNYAEIYYIRFVYIPSSDSIALSIYNDYKKSYSTNQISHSLKEITSCSLFHELINLVNGIYTNVELLNEETDKSLSNVDSYKSAIMFINVLTLRLRDIDDFTSISFNKFNLHHSQFQLYSLLIKYKEIISNFAKIKGSQVNISIDKQVPSYITSNQSRILQVIVNCAYAILEKVEFCTLFTEAKMAANNYIDIIIILTTNEKNKIEAMFNSISTYQMPQCCANTSIKNIEGLPLISTLYISKMLGKGIEVKKSAKNIFEIHVSIKNGFKSTSIDNSFMQDNCPNPKSAKSKARLLQKQLLKKSSSSVEYLLKFKRLNSPLKLNFPKCDDISSNCEIPIPDERELCEIKEICQIPPIHKDVISISYPICKYERRSRKFTQFYNKSTLSKIYMDEPEYQAIIADDNFVNIMVLKALLKLLNVNVMCTKDGLECVNAVKQLVLKGQFYKIKIIFMDMQMPIMDGIEATKEILRFLDANKINRPPIIGVSSDNNEDDRNKFLAAGINVFVRKPISKTVISDIYTNYVES